MKLDVQRRLAAKALKCSPKRISFDPEKASEIKEAITAYDVKVLINSKAIKKLPKRGVSRGRARTLAKKKSAGKRRGHGSRKGTKKSREQPKDQWMNRIRLQRKFLRGLKESGKLPASAFRSLYQKAKGGFFRSKRHIKLYLEEHKLV